MAGVRRQITPLKKLKTNYLKAFDAKKQQCFVHYDSGFDALMILFISPEEETTVHHIDEYIGVLFQADTKEIVGFQIEDFKNKFLTKHRGLRRVWQINDTTKLTYFDEISEWYESMKPKIIHEILKASEPLLSKQGLRLQALNRSLTSMQYFTESVC